MTATEIPNGLLFVDPSEIETTYRVCLWAAPGEGKSVAAASAPGPILVISADRPTAYLYARKHWREIEAQRAAEHAEDETVALRPAAEIREVRYRDAYTLDSVLTYLASDGQDVRTVVLDPVSNIYDQLVDSAPRRGDGDIDYQTVNKKLLGFVKELRGRDVNVVLVAHEKINDGKKGDGKMYPSLGGPSLINKLLGEMDIVAHIERRLGRDGDEEIKRYVGQLQPRGNLVCKEGTGCLGEVRIADLSRWFEVATEGLTDNSDLPWDQAFEAAEERVEAERAAEQQDPEPEEPEPEPETPKRRRRQETLSEQLG